MGAKVSFFQPDEEVVGRICLYFFLPTFRTCDIDAVSNKEQNTTEMIMLYYVCFIYVHNFVLLCTNLKVLTAYKKCVCLLFPRDSATGLSMLGTL